MLGTEVNMPHPLSEGPGFTFLLIAQEEQVRGWVPAPHVRVLDWVWLLAFGLAQPQLFRAFAE